MVAMAAFCGTRIRYSRLLVHLVSGNLAGGVEECGDSSGRRFHGVVDLVQSTYVTSLVLKVLDRFKGSTVTISALGRWFLGARARRFSDCHQQSKANSDMGTTTTARRRLAPAAVVIVRWSKNVNVIFMIFGLSYTSCELLEYIHIFLAKNNE
jgi:hypothetical protein